MTDLSLSLFTHPVPLLPFLVHFTFQVSCNRGPDFYLVCLHFLCHGSYCHSAETERICPGQQRPLPFLQLHFNTGPCGGVGCIPLEWWGAKEEVPWCHICPWTLVILYIIHKRQSLGPSLLPCLLTKGQDHILAGIWTRMLQKLSHRVKALNLVFWVLKLLPWLLYTALKEVVLQQSSGCLEDPQHRLCLMRPFFCHKTQDIIEGQMYMWYKCIMHTISSTIFQNALNCKIF